MFKTHFSTNAGFIRLADFRLFSESSTVHFIYLKLEVSFKITHQVQVHRCALTIAHEMETEKMDGNNHNINKAQLFSYCNIKFCQK